MLAQEMKIEEMMNTASEYVTSGDKIPTSL
jgi:hypothetical protein